VDANYEVDDAGDPVNDAMRRQVEATLRFMALSTLVGLIVIVVLAVAVSSVRGVLILVGIVYLLTSLGAYVYLRRTLNQRLKRGIPPVE
jgi:ABC-type bacteriocin/lantibiotic exporter with double-glycine peptidase domain